MRTTRSPPSRLLLPINRSTCDVRPRELGRADAPEHGHPRRFVVCTQSYTTERLAHFAPHLHNPCEAWASPPRTPKRVARTGIVEVACSGLKGRLICWRMCCPRRVGRGTAVFSSVVRSVGVVVRAKVVRRLHGIRRQWIGGKNKRPSLID